MRTYSPLVLFWYRTIISKMTYLTSKAERTRVGEVTSWIPDGLENVLFLLHDVGGHECYKNTAYVFQVCISMLMMYVTVVTLAYSS